MTSECTRLTTIPFDKEWEKFVDSIPGATIFHHSAWLNAISQAYKYNAFGLVLKDNNGEICAALPVANVNSMLTGCRWIAYPFSDYCFPLYRSESDQAMLLGSVLNFCEQERIDPLEIRWNMPQHNLLQFRQESVLHLLKLDSDINYVAKNIHPKHRSRIRQAEKHGVRIENGCTRRELTTFYRLHLETRRRKGIPVQPWKYFELLSENVIEAGHGFISLAYHGNQCIAGAVFLFFNKTLTYKYSASIQDQLFLRPNNLVLWKAIQWGCDNGYNLLDFGKTDRENFGLRDFKSRWGAEEQVLTYSVLSSKPIQTRTGRLKTIFEGLIKKSPLWVCQLSGELLYKHFA